MSLVQRLLCVCVLTTAAGAAFAQSGIKLSNRQIGLSLGAQHIGYYEYDNYGQVGGGWLNSEKGAQPALRAHYSTQGDALGLSDLWFAIDYEYARGDTQYDGYLQDLMTGTLTPYRTTTRVSSHDVQVKFGKGFSFFADRSLQLTPYMYYGHRQWERDLSRDQFGYLEVYEHSAVGAGLMTQYALTPKLVATLDASIGRTLNARMELEQATVFKLGEEPIYTYRLGLDYAASPKWRVGASYRLSKFRYGESPAVGAFYEPESKSTINSFFIGAGYAF